MQAMGKHPKNGQVSVPWVVHKAVRRFGVSPEEIQTMDLAIILRGRRTKGTAGHNFAKRAVDLVLGILVAPFAVLLGSIAAVAIRLDSPGPILYADERLGKDRRVFRCYKFRTMYVDSDQILGRYLESNPAARQEWERFQKLRGNDPRVTTVGGILRRLSLDELPQLVNVLRGDMSLVGPRPYLPREAALMAGYTDVILATRPGLTGLWQVAGRSDVPFSGRLRLDSWYSVNQRFWLDFTLILATIQPVLTGRGAF